MENFFANNSLSVGNTPLIKLNRITEGALATVLVKVESRNPAASVKCRLGIALIEDALNKNLLPPGKEVLEPTSGNTGIALAFVCAAKGIPLTLVMPETMSIERRKLLIAFGAKLVLSEGSLGMKGALEKANQMAQENLKYVILNQFSNPANSAIHEATTGPEIWRDTDGKVDIFISGVGTGGTLTGVSRFIKNQMKKQILTVAVEPASSPILSQSKNGQELKPAPHKIQGIGAGFIPAVLDMAQIDQIETVSNEEAIIYARHLAKDEGILAGISSGAAVAVAVRLAYKKENAGKTIVVILPDSAERYLSSALFDGVFDNKW